MVLTRVEKKLAQRILRSLLILVGGISVVALSSRCHAAAPNENRVTTGEFVVEPPTLIALGFEWYIDGDANRNASVSVSYRKKGTAEWKQGLPLFRLNGERTVTGLFNDDPSSYRMMRPDAMAFTYVAPNMFAGSIFDLEPDTEYECRFRLSDPDGVSGASEHVVTVRTRKEPLPARGGHVYHVYPVGFTGQRIEPSFDGLLAAYYTAAIGGDWYDAFPPRVQPSDIIVMHAGLYKDQRLRYGHEFLSGWKECCSTTWDGTYYLTQSGTADKPIAIIAAGDGEVVFDGDGNGVLFDVTAANYTYFEGITFRNTNLAILAGRKRILGATGLTVKHCRFEQVGMGIHTDYSGSNNFYIADNTFIGLHDPTEMIGWEPRTWGSASGFAEKSLDRSQYAVKIYGQGTVVAYNRVRNFHDALDHATYGDPDGWPHPIRDRMPVSIDFYNNDVSNTHDNCIETDGAMYNVRVLRNRCINIGEQALSEEPLMGGPAYFIRNIVYNSPGSGVKFSGDPSGGIFLHNTFLSSVRTSDGGDDGANAFFRNNLIIAENPKQPVFLMDTYDSYSSSDYNGFGFESSSEAPFVRIGPPEGKSVDYKDPLVEKKYGSLEEFSRATGLDQHSKIVNYRIFRNLHPVDPATPSKVYDPDQLDFSLQEGSAAVDAGVVLYNINDGFTGKAPDLGALEVGQPIPHYGPR
jgi:hypothetical protein